MVEFNPDGSLKLPGHMQSKKEKKEDKLRKERCLLVRKEIVSSFSPKSCKLKIRVSDAVSDTRFIEKMYRFFKQGASVPSEMSKVNDKEWEVKIGTDFRRCSDCCSLVSRYREFLDGNIIEEKGTCTYERQAKNFCYEDYF